MPIRLRRDVRSEKTQLACSAINERRNREKFCKYGKSWSYTVFPKLWLLSILEGSSVVTNYRLQLTRNVYVGCVLFRLCDYLAMVIESWL